MVTQVNLPYEPDEIWSAIFGASADEYLPWYAAYTKFEGGHGDGWDDARNTAIVCMYHEDDYEEVPMMQARVKKVEITFDDLMETINTLTAERNGLRYLEFDNYDSDLADVVLQNIVYGKYTFG
jgi:hypothetical protein